MKSLITFILLTNFVFAASSQNATLPPSYFNYSYDSTGNRIKRELIVISNSPPAPGHHRGNDTTGNIAGTGNQGLSKVGGTETNAGNKTGGSYEAFIGEKKVSIFPNPTKGELSIAISNFDKNCTGSITISDMSGKVLFRNSNISASNSLNISGFARGSYVLRVVVNGKNKEYVLVKE